MRGKILDEEFREDGSTYICKATPWGTFKVTVYCDIEEEDIVNSWDGERFALFKCDLKAHQARAKAFYQRYLGAKQIYQSMTASNKISEEGLKALEKQVRDMELRWREAKYIADIMQKTYPSYVDKVIKARRDVRARIEKLRQQNEE